ncbi:MAG: hypothetical protein IT532_00185 [Burkholderiales bacterium]|nr:hypothetical protein [Burkholderiales bacterium]
MPFYRINGAIVHMQGTKLPAPCGCFDPDDDGRICLALSGYQCDYPMPGPGTCDRHLCTRHAHEVGPDRHYCPQHFERAQRHEEEG